ncbi:MAG: DegV family protein, partial [Dehalococcoidales bacterium]|nr:DegV family protein [Dehalococcoidales bacterium]
MVNKVTVVTDSVACLPKEQAAKYGIRVVPVKILFEKKIYSDGVDLSTAEAYRLLEKSPDYFSTSPSSPNDYINLFRGIISQGQDVLCITVSSKLSTVYNVACLAKDTLKKENPQATISVMDSMTATASEGLIVLAAAQSAAQGKELDDVIRTANKVMEHTYMFIALDTIRHAYRTGRIPKIATQVGTALGVKPLLTISGGVVHLVGVVRTRQRGVERLIENMKRKVGGQPVHTAVMHTAVPEEGEKLKQLISDEFDCKELFLTEVSPIIGYAIGTGVLG